MISRAWPRRLWITLAVSIAIGGAPLPAGAADPQLSALLRRVDDHYNHLSSLRCSFTEHYSGLGIERTESGTLLLRKPGRMRWNYTAPPGKLFLLDGRYAWSYTPGDAQVQRVAAKQLDDLRSPLRFLLGHTQLARELTGPTVSLLPGGSRITGIPRGMEERIAQLSLDVSVSGQIQAIRLEERDGSITEFEFRNLEENVPLPPAVFHFAAPRGIPVVDGMPPI